MVRCRLCHKKFKHTNDVYAANEAIFLDLISYGTQQVEPQFLMACFLTSGPVLYWYEEGMLNIPAA